MRSEYATICYKTLHDRLRLWAVNSRISTEHAQFSDRLVKYMFDVIEGKMAPASLDDIIQTTKLPAEKLDAIMQVMKNDVKHTLSIVKEGSLARVKDKVFERYNFLKLRPPYKFDARKKLYVSIFEVERWGVKDEELDPLTRFVFQQEDDPSSIPATRYRHKLAYVRSIAAISCSGTECLNCRTK